MYKTFIIVLLVVVGLSASAQNWHAADSLRKALGKTNTDTGKVNTLLRLAEFEIFKPGEFKKDLDSAATYLDQAKSTSKNIGSIDVSGHILFTESNLLKERGQKALGKALVEKAIQILSKGTDKYLLGQAYLALSEYYDYNNIAEWPERMQLTKQAANVFKHGGYIEREAYCYKVLGDIDTSAEASIAEVKIALALYQSIHYTKLQSVYDVFGLNYYDLTNYGQALDYYFKALNAAKSDHDTTMQLCEINNHIGLVYFQQHDFQQAINYFKASLITAEANKDIQTVYLLATNIAGSYINLEQPREALKMLQTTVNKYPLPHNELATDCRVSIKFLETYTLLKQFKLAKPYSDHLLSIINSDQLKNRVIIGNIYTVLIKYFFATKQYANMLTYLNKDDAMLHQVGFPPNVLANNDLWFQLDTAQHNYKDAVEHLLRYKQISDSTFTATKNQQIQQLQLQFNTKEKENQINSLNQKAALDKSNLQRANLLKNVTAGGIVLVLILAGLLYRQSRLRKRNNRIVTRKNEVITQKNEQLQKLVAEKEWLLKEVHHRVKNNLHSVICLLEAQAAYLENDALTAIENSQHRIYTMSLIHQKLYQSEDVKSIDMAAYIPELVQYLRDSFDISGQIHFQLTVEPIQLNAAQAIPLALIINEALTNSIKYAFPNGRKGEVTISLTDNANNYKLELTDNGIGMDTEAIKVGTGSLGLELMKGLTKEIGGKITFENSKGVKISVIFGRDMLHELEQPQVDDLEFNPVK